MDVADFRRRLRGSVLIHDDDGYHDARRVWNGLINRYPAVIARCEGVPDVVAAVEFARSAGRPVTMRGGGHNVAGAAVRGGALLVDLSGMIDVEVDLDERASFVTTSSGASTAAFRIIRSQFSSLSVFFASDDRLVPFW